MTGDHAGGPPLVRRAWEFAERLPGIGDVVALPRRAGEATVNSVRGMVGVVLDEVFAVLSRTDLTALITQNLDLNQLLATVDLDAVLARLDLNELLAQIDLNAVLSRVDLNEIIASLDLNPTIAKLDLNPAVDNLDLVGVAQTVVNGIDLNSIVRDATTSVSGEVLDDVRTSSVRADDRVEQFVSRILRRQTDDE